MDHYKIVQRVVLWELGFHATKLEQLWSQPQKKCHLEDAGGFLILGCASRLGKWLLTILIGVITFLIGLLRAVISQFLSPQLRIQVVDCPELSIRQPRRQAEHVDQHSVAWYFYQVAWEWDTTSRTNHHQGPMIKYGWLLSPNIDHCSSII